MQSEIREQCVYVRGEVNVRTLNAAAYKQWQQQCSNPSVNAVDFSAVENVDSACIALMLSALRQKGAGSLQWRGIPESVYSLAQLYEVESWLND